MKCPICEKSYHSNESFLAHIEFHKNNSILSKTSEVKTSSKIQNFGHNNKIILLNLEKIFGVEKFEIMIENKINQIENIEELVNRRNFIEQVKKIIKKNPFVYIPYFVEDLMHGFDSRILLDKYYITNYSELQTIVEGILRFDRDRYKLRQHSNAFEMNLKNPTWYEKYRLLKDNCYFFKNELLQLFFSNIIRAYILIIMIDYVETGIDKESIISKSQNLKNDYYLFKFIDDDLANQFNQFFNSNFDNLVSEIIFELIDENILKRKWNDPKLLTGELSIDKIQKNIIDELRYNAGNLKETSLRNIIDQKYPSLKLIPRNILWITALKELETQKIIDFQFKSNFRNDTLILLNEDYQKLQRDLRILGNSPPKFYGRKISPSEFISELSKLEKGDFGDEDDQITRLAGLVLAESVTLLPPKENIPEFDFSINIKDYNFRKDQLEAISKLNFKINSEIFHCKVMLNEKLTLGKYKTIKKIIPPNEQGVIITFSEISKNVKKELSKDSSVQIIDEEGVKIWVSITSIIPSRKNAVAILHNDPISKLDKKIVLINLIDYEKGIADVSIFPEMNQALVLIRSLEEITLRGYSEGHISSQSLQYLEFLNLLRTCSPDKFEEGIFETPVNKENYIYERLSDSWEFKFNDAETRINLYQHSNLNSVSCTCGHSRMVLSQERPHTLCKHLVAAINLIMINGDFIQKSGQGDNRVIKTLRAFFVKGVVSSISKIEFTIPESSSHLHAYLQCYAKSLII